MRIRKPFNLRATGKALPALIVSSEQLERMLDIPAGWSEKYSGVAARRRAVSESNTSLGAAALGQALDEAGLTVADLDLILCGAATFDYPIPSQASLIKHALPGGMEATTATIDLDATCLSFVAGFDIAVRLLDGIRYRRIAVVSAEIASQGLDPSNWECSTLFGDGAAAAILEWTDDPSRGFIHGDMKTWSEGVFLTMVKGGGNAYFFREHPYDPALHSFQMEGIKLLRLAQKRIPEFMEAFFTTVGAAISEVDLVIPHQASKAGIQLFRDLYDLRPEQVFSNLAAHGNCIAASIPMALHDAIGAGALQRGQTCLICGTSAGFSIGGVLFRY